MIHRALPTVALVVRVIRLIKDKERIEEPLVAPKEVETLVLVWHQTHNLNGIAGKVFPPVERTFLPVVGNCVHGKHNDKV